MQVFTVCKVHRTTIIWSKIQKESSFINLGYMVSELLDRYEIADEN